MIDKLEQMARSGAKDAARKMLQELQSMLENLQMARPGQQMDGGDDALYEAMIAKALGIDMTSKVAATPWLATTVRLAWRVKLMISAAVDARMRLRQRAELDAVDVFARNLGDLLLAAPAGTRASSAQRMISDPSRRISSFNRPTALSSLSPRKEFEQTSSARPSVLWTSVLRVGRISCSTTGTPRPAICHAASLPASPPPMMWMACFRSNAMNNT